MAIVRAEHADLDQCTDLLFISEIGKLYFPKKESLRAELEKSLGIDEIFVEKTVNAAGAFDPDIQGVIWYQKEGLFHAFPYLHMIAVRDGCRHQGVGTRLMDFYEEDSLHSGKNRLRTRTFLLVSESNSAARQFYRNRGYTVMGKFDGLFRKGVTEILLMKRVRETQKSG